MIAPRPFQIRDHALLGSQGALAILLVDFGGPTVQPAPDLEAWTDRFTTMDPSPVEGLDSGFGGLRRLVPYKWDDGETSGRNVYFQRGEILATALALSARVDERRMVVLSITNWAQFDDLMQNGLPFEASGFAVACSETLHGGLSERMTRLAGRATFTSVLTERRQATGDVFAIFRHQPPAAQPPDPAAAPPALDAPRPPPLAAAPLAAAPQSPVALAPAPDLLADSGIEFGPVKLDGGDLTGIVFLRRPLSPIPTIFALREGQAVAAAALTPVDPAGRRMNFRMELPKSVLYDEARAKLSLQVGWLSLGPATLEMPKLNARFVSAARLLDFEISPDTAHLQRKPFGIILYTHTRTEGALQVLESLKRQGALPLVEVWMDGDQGNPKTRKLLDAAEASIKRFGVREVRRHRGNLGFRKLMLHSLMHMTTKYQRFLVLEDDCFPTRDAVETFRAELDKYADDPSVLTIYGHHFKLPSERPRCSRFQGWGWATWSARFEPFLAELAYLYSIPEPSYLDWARAALTPDIRKLVDCTPPRLATDTLTKFFAWDETLCLLAALDGKWHVPTPDMCIYNFGVGDDSQHFKNVDWYRKPPFNMILRDEVWSHYGRADAER